MTTVICATIILVPVFIIVWKAVMAITRSLRDDPGQSIPPFILFDMFLHDEWHGHQDHPTDDHSGDDDWQ